MRPPLGAQDKYHDQARQRRGLGLGEDHNHRDRTRASSPASSAGASARITTEKSRENRVRRKGSAGAKDILGW